MLVPGRVDAHAPRHHWAPPVAAPKDWGKFRDARRATPAALASLREYGRGEAKILEEEQRAVRWPQKRFDPPRSAPRAE
eukprot:12619457-Alexandrium_andersonii.AAC.1